MVDVVVRGFFYNIDVISLVMLHAQREPTQMGRQRLHACTVNAGVQDQSK